MKIRKATLHDLQQINNLNEKFFHENGRDFEKILKSSDKEMYLVEENAVIIGFAGVSRQSWNQTAQGIDIFVHPKHRGKGIGSKLVQEMINGARKMNVRCLIVEAPSQSAALPLYQENGFRKCGYNDHYYSNNSDESAIFLSFDF